MQKSLFDEAETSASAPAGNPGTLIDPITPTPALTDLARPLPAHLRLGTSSWNYPGWAGLVWEGTHSETNLSRYGLTAYAKHPLFRTVSIDRGFYRPLTAAQFADYAAQVGPDFRFVVKAPGLVTDALVRGEAGRGMQPNPHFLNAAEALRTFVQPAVEGLGCKIGSLVFQISPLPGDRLAHMPRVIGQLHSLLRAIPDLKHAAPDGVVAVEVRDPQWLIPEFVEALRDAGATYCMGLHAKMPHIVEQLPILRALWPGPLVCRWNLNPLHGAYGYEQAGDLYAPFDKMVDPDLATRAALVRVITGTAGAGQNVYVTISNQAEGSAPLSVIELARALGSENRDS